MTPPAARAVLLVRGTAANPFLSLALSSGRMPCLAQLQELDISGANPSERLATSCRSARSAPATIPGR